jgi:hypothetical protein
MDQQQKASDNPVETIAKTVPGEFVSFVILLKAFLVNNTGTLIVLGIFLAALIPPYATRVLKITSGTQIALMVVSYLAWFALLIPDDVDRWLMQAFQVTTTFKSNIVAFGAVVLVFQFAAPFLTKPAAPPTVPPAAG